MWHAEHILVGLARILGRTELAHSAPMKAAQRSLDQHDAFRSEQLAKILQATQRYDIPLRDSVVVDFGCGDGAVTRGYTGLGVGQVIGVDCDAGAIARARHRHAPPGVSYFRSDKTSIPLDDGFVDLVVSYDVFEHVAKPRPVLEEIHRILKPGGRVLIGTWGWRHPFAPHLWSVMPVPWAHLLVSERTLLRACRQVYRSDWYQPTMHDVDGHGRKIENKYEDVAISESYLNKLLIRDFESRFAEAGFDCRTHLVPFGSRWACWARPLLRLRSMRELLAGYVWFVLTKDGAAGAAMPGADARAHSAAA